MINLNDTTPAAAAGKTNVLWQVDGSGNISAYVPTGPSILTSVSLTGQTTDIAPTTLYTPTATGVYRINTFIYVTTVATGGTWQSRINFKPLATTTNDAISPISATGLSSYAFRTITAFITSGNIIEYLVTGAGITGSPQYSFYAVVERLI